ncbi:ABC transporter permease [Aurantimonas endophytica]|uniref:Putative spermidine/putrescine transport system permease protein n=1 Tax=Aurantimonas endophytica TaxID=1522175 RepID=A0A7W6HCE8_9HYPH|nr:ABC transporter permease [Aurantimonas endophytica]MBB4002588.1 putative spermidine/putrescine transport system permease protein [Aurantimonas endophytica]MCO6403469.1 ABC transporter permease subunit [Aurantimonas endophytica]
MTVSRTALLGLIALPLAFFSAFFLVPLATVFAASVTSADGGVTLANYARILFDEYHWSVIGVTFRLGILTTLICLVIGYPLAWYLVRIVEWRAWRRVCVILLILPLFTSNIVRSFGWMVLLGRNGLINETLIGAGLIERPIRLLGTEAGILIGLVYILLPFVVLTVGNALAKVDRSLEQASADLGASPASTFWHVTFPLSIPGVVSGAIIVFALAVSAYVTPALLSGGRVTVLAILVFQQYSSVFDFHYGGALAITLLVFTLAMIAVSALVSRQGAR